MIGKYLYSIILISMVFCACTKDDATNIVVGNNPVDIVFTISMPSASTYTETRALSETNENTLSSIYILAFDENDNYAYSYYTNRVTSGQGTNTQRFVAKLVPGQYSLIVAANAGEAISSAYPSGILPGTPKSTVEQNLKITTSGRLVTNSTDQTYIPIPYWGDTGLTPINSSTTIPVKMVRMLAKINVSLQTDAAKNLTLQSISLYNYNDQGMLVPSTTPTNWDKTNNKAYHPTIPSSANRIETPITYSQADITTTGTASNGVIYTFEAEEGSDETLPVNTCLVIGGEYLDGNVYYYRVDFMNSSSRYIPILRNHLYDVSVATVSGPGYNTPEQAFKAAPMNIEATIIPWDNGNFSNIVFDGQYMLGVSQGVFNFSQDPTTTTSNNNKAVITTDYPGGWTISKIVDENDNDISWLTTNGSFSAINSTDTLRIICSKNSMEANRTGYIYLTAGRLNYKITVSQTIIQSVSLNITNAAGAEIQELTFPSNVGGTISPQSFNVYWTPTSASCNVSVSNVGANTAFKFDGTSITNGTITNSSGKNTYSIKPAPMTAAELSTNPFLEKVSQIGFSVSNGYGYATDNIFLRQINYNLVTNGVQNFYLMNGDRYSFNVTSNTAWTASITSNTTGVVTSLETTSGGYNTTTGTPVYFRVYNDLPTPTKYSGSATITFTSPTGLFAPKTVTINCISGVIQPLANSYIVTPSGAPILIPVAQANQSALGNQITTSTVVNGELLWTDNSNGLNSSSNISAVSFIKTGTDGYILVRPGSEPGNAVVAAKVASKIVWSWHVWVTTYDPSLPENQRTMNGFTSMSLNLAALSDVRNSDKNKGLTYQWGRKDPFPPSYSSYKVYNASGVVVKYDNNATNTLLNSVQNPMTAVSVAIYITPPWSGSVGANSWGPDTKTAYDPCPYGWRVSPKEMYAGLNNTNFPVVSGVGGRQHATGGYYPTNGYYGGILSSVSGALGYYWSSKVGSQTNNGDRMYFDNTLIIPTVFPSGNDGAHYGYAVRCIKIP